MISRKFLFADHKNTIQHIRDSDSDIGGNISHIYILIYLTEIHGKYIRFSSIRILRHIDKRN